MRVKSYIAFLLILATASPAWAQSKSVVIRTHCTVRPLVQMSAQRGVKTNPLDQFSTVESYEHRPAGNTKVLSVTAL